MYILLSGAVGLVVYVKDMIGSEDASCGSHSNPCQHLQTAVDKYPSEIIYILIGVVGLVVYVQKHIWSRRCFMWFTK